MRTSRPPSLHALALALVAACTPATPAPASPAAASPAAAAPGPEAPPPAELPATQASSGGPHAAPASGAPSAHEHGGQSHGGQSHGGQSHGSPSHGFHKDFSDAKAFSASFDNPERDAWQQPEAVLDAMKIAPGSTVVDLGAGTGYFEPRLSRRVGAEGKVLALDVEPGMVEFLKQRVQQQKLANVEPRLVQPNDPGLAPGSVSRILIVNTWHHIGERPSYAKKLAAALGRDGEVWIVDFTLEAEKGPPAEYRLPAAQVVRELEQGGLRAHVVEAETLPDQYIVRGLR